MIVGKVNQIGDFLTTNNTNIANQYAENLQLEVSFDGKYDGYSWLWFCGYSYTQPKAVPILFDSTTSLITLPAEAFKHDGSLYVQAAVIKEGAKYTLEPVKFCIGQSLKQDFIEHGPTETEILQALIREIVKNEYDGPLQELITEAGKQQEIASEQQETAEQQQTNAGDMQAEAKRQQSEAEKQQAEAERQQEVVNNLIGTSEQQQETITEQQSKVEELISEAQQQQETAIEQQDLAQQQQTNASNLQTEATRQQEVVNSLIVEAESQQTTAERQQTKAGEMQNALTLNLEEYKRMLDAGEFIPEHKWEGSTIFFKHSDGTWGEGIDLNSPDLANYMLKSGGTFSGDVTFANGKTIKGITKDGRSLTILCVYTEDSVLLGSPYLKTKLRSSTVPIWDNGTTVEKIITESGGEFIGDLNLGNAVYLNAKKSDGGSLTIFGISDIDETVIGTPILRARIRSKVKPIWDNGEEIKKFLTEDDATPAGVINQFAGEIAPNGYLLCQGQAISRTAYASLFNVISTKYGAGDGSTTFNLPDLRGRVPVGKDDRDTDFKTLGAKGGEKAHTLTVQEMPSHNHNATLTINSGGAHTHSASSNSAGAHTHSVSGSAASAGGHTHTYGYGKSAYAGGAGNTVPALDNYGVGNTNTNSAGAHTHSVSGTAASNGAHSHTITVNSGGAHTHTGTVSIGSTGGGQAHNNMQPYIVLNYIIKY